MIYLGWLLGGGGAQGTVYAIRILSFFLQGVRVGREGQED